MDEARLEQLESKLAHLELALQELNETAVAQGEEIGRLNQLCACAAWAKAPPGEAPADEERPPHY